MCLDVPFTATCLCCFVVSSTLQTRCEDQCLQEMIILKRNLEKNWDDVDWIGLNEKRENLAVMNFRFSKNSYIR